MADFARPRAVLAIVVSRIGDTLLATPALRAIAGAWPDAKLTCLAHPKRAEVLRNLPFLLRALWRTQRMMDPGHYMEEYDLTPASETSSVFWPSRAIHRLHQTDDAAI